MKKNTRTMLTALILSILFVVTPPVWSFAEANTPLPGESAVVNEGFELVEDEAEDTGADADELPVYDADRFKEASETLGELDEETQVPVIIKTAYELTVRSFSDDTETEKGAETVFLADLLASRAVDHVLVTGADAEGNKVEWILVSPDEESPYYVLDPSADVSREDDEEELAGFMQGSDYLEGWTPDEEFAGEEFEELYPLSKEDYIEEEPEAAEETAEVAEDAESTENQDQADVVEGETAEAEATEEAKPEDADAQSEKAPEEKRAYGAAAYTYDLGTCGPNTTCRVETDDYYNYTLVIAGSGSMNNYSSGSSYKPWNSYKSRINKIVIGKNVTTIGNNAFYGMSSLQSIVFKGKNVTYIGNYAFYNDDSLLKITLPAGVSYIGERAFSECSNLQTVYIGDGADYIGNYAFAYCGSLSKVTLPESVNIIGDYAFYNDYNLTTIALPSGLRNIGMYAVYNCQIVYFHGKDIKWKLIGGPNAVSASTKVRYATNMSKASVKLSTTACYYAARQLRPIATVKLKVNGKYRTLKKGTDFKVIYKNNINAGRATVTVQGINKYYGSVKRTFTIKRRPCNKAKVGGVQNKYYTGKPRTLSLVVKVKIGKKYVTLKKGRDYTVRYKNNTRVSTKKNRAQVTITGKGNYTGRIIRRFYIAKAPVGLRFKSKALTRTAISSSYKYPPIKSVKAKLALTYTSSNPSVASVNKKTGLVVPRRVGTTVITVRSKATGVYRAGKASYKLTIRNFKWSELNYSFSNYGTRVIPESTFRLYYNATQARTLYSKYNDLGNNGVCFGISASCVMQRMRASGIKPTNFRSGAKMLSSLSLYDYYKSSSVRLKDVIEAMHVSQISDNCYYYIQKNMYDYSGLVKQVRTGRTVIIGMRDRSNFYGHIVVGYKMKKGSNKDYIYVYDNNYPDEAKYIILYKNSSGRYTSWYYNSDYRSSGIITYIPAATYRTIWRNRKAARTMSQMFISSNDFEIRDGNGTLVAEMKDSVFNSTRDDVYLGMTFDMEIPDHIVYMPAGEYTVTDTSAEGGTLEVTSMDTDQSITVTTDSGSVTVETDDTKGVNKATIDAAKDDSYVVSLVDGTSGDEPDEIVFTGEGNNKEVTLGTEDGSCVIENAKDVSLKINGEEKGFTVQKGNVVIEE